VLKSTSTIDFISSLRAIPECMQFSHWFKKTNSVFCSFLVALQRRKKSSECTCLGAQVSKVIGAFINYLSKII
jgi:RNase P protein component